MPPVRRSRWRQPRLPLSTSEYRAGSCVGPSGWAGCQRQNYQSSNVIHTFSHCVYVLLSAPTMLRRRASEAASQADSSAVVKASEAPDTDTAMQLPPVLLAALSQPRAHRE